MPPERFPRNKDQLLREVDVRIRLSDIRRLHGIRERLSPHWWEPAVVIMLFASALGLLASLYEYAARSGSPLNKWLYFWFGLMTLTNVLALQILLVRAYNFRRANGLLMRQFEEMRAELDEFRKRLDAAAPPAPEPGEPPPPAP